MRVKQRQRRGRYRAGRPVQQRVPFCPVCEWYGDRIRENPPGVDEYWATLVRHFAAHHGGLS